LSKEWKNQLYFGDNIDIMRECIPDEYIDLIYLDPPFKSNATYNVLFQEKNGTNSDAQITAFEDTWHWDIKSEEIYWNILEGKIESPKTLADYLQAVRNFLGTNDMMSYLVMMSPRLLEMKRILKDAGSIYLHCDPTAGHYLKLLLDAVFGAKQFKNEIIWCKNTTMYQSTTRFVPQHDIIFYYVKNVNNANITFNWEDAADSFSETTIKKYRHEDENGRKFRLHGRNIKGSPIKNRTDINIKWLKKAPELVRVDYLDEKPGVKPKDWWPMDILNQNANERLGYPTQKPRKLLEKIILASSNKGEIVMDPFCGCGTTVSAAEKLNRRWIGIDITYLAINLIKRRLEDTFGQDLNPYKVHGVPQDIQSAKALAIEDPYQFEWWAIDLIDARPAQDRKKGSDKGIDGIKYFHDDSSGKVKKIIVQVKSGNVDVSQIRDLKGVLERENAQIGAFITLQEPTKPMIEEAATAGFYKQKEKKIYKLNPCPRIQILTIENLLHENKKLDFPSIKDVTFKEAERKKNKTSQHGEIFK